LPHYVQKLINDGKLGRKSKEGLYKLIKYENGLKRQTVYDINTGVYRDVMPYAFPFVQDMKSCLSDGEYEQAFKTLVNNNSPEAEICLSFLLKYIIYSLYCAEEVGFSSEAADDVMAAGFNWCPPLAMYEALNSAAEVSSLIKERLSDICKKVDVDHYLSKVKPSKYDYRSFFKSGR